MREGMSEWISDGGCGTRNVVQEDVCVEVSLRIEFHSHHQ
jgi:hypothetical protein